MPEPCLKHVSGIALHRLHYKHITAQQLPAAQTSIALQLLDRAPAGVYVSFDDFAPTHSTEELEQLRQGLPELPDSFIPTCACGHHHDLAFQLATEGAIHGDRIKGRIALSCDEEGVCRACKRALRTPAACRDWRARVCSPQSH